MPRIAVLNSHPAQYTGPFFRHLARRPELDLTVLYCSSLGIDEHGTIMRNFDQSVVWDIDLMSGYEWKLLNSSVHADPQRRWSMLGTGLVRELVASRYDLVVNYGWAFPADWLSFLLARHRKIPFLLYGDTSVRDEGTLLVSPVRRAVMAALFRTASGALYTGTFNRDFYIRHGMAPENLWFSPYAIDSARFRGRSRIAARQHYGLREGICYFLFSGSLISRKRPVSLLETVARLQRRGHPAGVIFAGSGSLEADLRRRVDELAVKDAHLLGFVNQESVPDVYAAADVLVLPSEKDPRATVVNEAMTAGLPVLVSTGTGVWGPGDLVQHDREGLVFDLDHPDALLTACERLLDPEVRSRMGVAAAARADWWSFDLAADGWVAASTYLTRHQG